MHLRVLTLNVQNTEGPPQRQRLLNQALRDLRPDVASLQEVASEAQLDDLLDGTGLSGSFQSSGLAYEVPFVDQYGGTALATRPDHRLVEVLDQRVLGAQDVPWCAVAATLSFDGLGDQLVVATTAAWRLDEEAARERQALALADLDARHRGPLPTIIAGDLNAAPDASSIRFLTGRQSLEGRSVHYHDAWEVAGEGGGATWTVDNPLGAAEIGAVVRQPHHRRRLDYVLVGSWHAHPDATARIRTAALVGAEPSGGEWLSDHLGVVVDLELTRDAPDDA